MSEGEKEKEGRGLRGGHVGAEGEEMGGSGRTRRRKRDRQSRKRVANGMLTF